MHSNDFRGLVLVPFVTMFPVASRLRNVIPSIHHIIDNGVRLLPSVGDELEISESPSSISKFYHCMPAGNRIHGLPLMRYLIRLTFVEIETYNHLQSPLKLQKRSISSSCIPLTSLAAACVIALWLFKLVTTKIGLLKLKEMKKYHFSTSSANLNLSSKRNKGRWSNRR